MAELTRLSLGYLPMLADSSLQRIVRSCSKVGLFCRIVGLFCRIVGLFGRIVGLFCRIVGLFCRIVGLCQKRPIMWQKRPTIHTESLVIGQVIAKSALFDTSKLNKKN